MKQSLSIRYFKSSIIRKLILLITLIILIIYPIHLLFNGSISSSYFENLQIPKPLNPNSNTIENYFHDTINQVLLKNEKNSKKLMIFPKDYQDEMKSLKVTNIKYDRNRDLIIYSGNSSSMLSYELINLPKHSHEIQIFNGIFNQDYPNSCSRNQNNINLTISDNFIFNDDFNIMITKLIEQLNNDESFIEIDGFFEKKLPKMLQDNLLHKHFYKFAGTSIWLKKYGVHLMISRVIFSRKGLKWNPQISLLYAQIYDKNWNEIYDLDLLIPVIQPDGSREYESLNFPKFLPIAYYFDYNFTKRRWYGPEDTRIMLIENEYEEEEPVIIFNSDHRVVKNITQISKENDISYKLNFEMKRSMFIGWPFRYQLGKSNTDGFNNEKFDNIKYNKVLELKIENQERQSVEKNWTPFIIPRERRENKGDQFIHFVYQWDNLEILKCDITNNIENGISNCMFIYKDSQKNVKKVGPIRGGTEMIPLSSIDPKYKYEDIWIGFLRAHIKHCGCGRSMYRPNFYIFSKSATIGFKVDYLSSSISFNIPVTGWRKHEIQCASRDPNVLIPNGISMWEQNNEMEEDILSLTLSVADENNSIIHIYGLKQIIDNLIENNDITMSNNFGEVDLSYDNESLLKCVLDSSIEFCKQYGLEQTRLGITEEVLLKKEKEKDNKNDKDKDKKQ
ncbi:BMT3 [Candida pseudojiufengensis]|uniref:BMT3 n=1 Tax=Candida pseudojiufengensis TaxID=497109 RepID=UPI002224D3DF|nr:BMT3 [Candida pseudojiufengensis]KAI5963138.1 BMT3 [Candida pseudojiufengensis]